MWSVSSFVLRSLFALHSFILILCLNRQIVRVVVIERLKAQMMQSALQNLKLPRTLVSTSNGAKTSTKLAN